mmetsp:Transcript_26651/g.47950  ORF Transcript_26651/g.47950 Transcript_26651/m.47950 type:complete len:169 (+) Transcript_26651:1612-2118(+)
MEEDLFQLLGVEPNCSESQLRKAYLRLAMRYHPDKCPEPDAADKFHRLQQAYLALSDPDARRKHLAVKETQRAREAKEASATEQLRKFKTDLLAREAAHKKKKAPEAPVQKEFGEAMVKVEWVNGSYTRQMLMELFEDFGPIHEVVMLPEKSKAFVIFLHNNSAVTHK